MGFSGERGLRGKQSRVGHGGVWWGDGSPCRKKEIPYGCAPMAMPAL